MKEKKHNVAVAVIWFQRYKECSDTQGTPRFTSSVWRFYHSLLNLGDELPVKTKVSEYIKNIWKPNVDQIVQRRLTLDNISTNDDNNISLYTDEVINERIVELFEYIIQTIQDSGVGWPTHEEITSYMITQE